MIGSKVTISNDVTERRTITHDGQSNRDFFILVDDTLLLVGEITEINRIKCESRGEFSTNSVSSDMVPS